MAPLTPAGPGRLGIIQVVAEFSRDGGAETVAWELQRRWLEDGTPSQVLTASAPGLDPALAGAVRFALPPALSRRVPTRGRWRYAGRTLMVPAFTLAATAALRRADRPGGWAEGAVVLSHGDSLLADVVVLHAVNAASLAQKRRDGQWRWAINPMHLWVEGRDRRMLRGLRARRYVAVSRRVADELALHHHVPRDRVVVIPNGVDLVRFAATGRRAGLRQQFGIPEAAKLLLFVGHEFDRKGLAHAVLALREPGCAAAHLVAVGDGDPAPYVKLAAEAGVAGRLHLTGPRRDLPSLYREADAFVLPTAYETFSLVCMEAMASGLPVLATGAGGIEEYLADGINGFVIERDPASVAAGVAKLLGDPALVSRLRAGARATAERFDWPQIARRYTELLAQVWNEKQSTPPLDRKPCSL